MISIPLRLPVEQARGSWFWLGWNSQRSVCLCFLSAGITAAHHHGQLFSNALNIYLFTHVVSMWGGCAHTHTSQCICGGQRTAYRSQFCPSTQWVLELKLRPSGLAANAEPSSSQLVSFSQALTNILSLLILPTFPPQSLFRGMFKC